MKVRVIAEDNNIQYDDDYDVRRTQLWLYPPQLLWVYAIVQCYSGDDYAGHDDDDDDDGNHDDDDGASYDDDDDAIYDDDGEGMIMIIIIRQDGSRS